jgi:transcriptional regulator with XRE-family HTH domain
MPKTNSSSITSERVGEEIRRVRDELGWTQKQLAERLDAKPAYVSAIEAGRANLTVGSLALIAEAFGRGLELRFPAVQADYRSLDRDLAQLQATKHA